MKRLLLLFAILGVGLIPVAATRAQLREVPRCQQGMGVPTLPRIQGYVRDASGNGVAEVRLELLTLNTDGSIGSVIQTETTDRKGRFRFKRHKDRIYALRVTSGDSKFDDLKLQQVSNAMMSSSGPMNLVLILEKSPCITLSLAR